MSREFEILVPAGQNRERLDVYLANHIENATRSKVQGAIDAGLVLVNGKQAKASYKLSGGEKIHVTIPKPPPPDVVAENIPIEIVYEDNHLLIVNKPAGMVTHPAYGNYTGTLVNALLHYCQTHLSSVNDVSRPGIVHRLDKDTSGLMVIAKDDSTHAALAEQFSQRTIEREYWSIVWGRFDQKGKKSGIIDAALGRSVSDRKRIAVRDSGKTAVTEYTALEEFDYLSLVKLKLRTGRTHQIRVHLHHVGHPVFGDPTYGGRRIAWGGTEKKKKEEVQKLLDIIHRQALHARTIGFVHPVTRVKMMFTSELPSDMNDVLLILRAKR